MNFTTKGIFSVGTIALGLTVARVAPPARAAVALDAPAREEAPPALTSGVRVGLAGVVTAPQDDGSDSGDGGDGDDSGDDEGASES